MGVSSIAAGIAGAFVTGGRPSGGPGTAFFLALAFLTLVASLGSVILGDGVSKYLFRGKKEDTSHHKLVVVARRDCGSATLVAREQALLTESPHPLEGTPNDFGSSRRPKCLHNVGLLRA